MKEIHLGSKIMDRNTELAYNFIQYTDENLFVTGKAGTGKSTFLRKVISETSKKTVVVAPTGVAAIQISGVTMHSLFQLPFGIFIKNYKTSWGSDTAQQVINEHHLLSQLRLNSQKKKLLQNVELIIIDEVSMLRADYLDAIDSVLRFVRKKDFPFGGCQMLFVGDLFQLPPVLQRHEAQILLEHYESPYFFDSHVLKEKAPVCIEFENIYRQSDSTFINLLNNVRNNSMTNDDFELLYSRYFPTIDTNQDIITLSSHNATVDSINSSALQAIPSRSHTFSATITGTFPEHVFPMPHELELKEGAQVMFVKNDKGEIRRYYNGKIGKIARINRFDNEITIEFKNGDEPITIEPEKWENIRYHYNEVKDKIEEEVIGTFQQFPLKLAWAVTIHKSQGMTFDEAIIDAGKSFSPGQVYVALSRIRTLDGIYLKSRITPQSVLIDPKIIEYFKEINSNNSLENALQWGQLTYLENELKNYFHFELIQETIKELYEKNNTANSPLWDELFVLFKDMLNKTQELHTNGLKFLPFISDNVQKENWKVLNDRYSNAIQWYERTIEEKIILPIQEKIDKFKIQKNTTKLLQLLHQYKIAYKKHLQKMLHSKSVVEHLSKNNNLENALHLLKNQNSIIENISEEKAPVKQPSHLISLELFRKHKDISKVAEIRELKENSIHNHLSRCIQEDLLDIREVMKDEVLLTILDILKKYPQEKSLTFFKEKLSEEISFEDIRMVMAFRNKKRITSSL